MEQKIEEIYQAISQNYSKNNFIGLASGNGGFALFLFYYYKLTNDPKALEQANEILEKTFDLINNGDIYPTFCNGLAGVGWLIEHLEQNNFIKCDTNAILKDIDEYVYTSAIEDFKEDKYDFLHGAIGKGFYFLNRKIVNFSYLEEITKHMLKISISPNENQLCWKSLSPHTGEVKYNLSLSHGIANIINYYSRLFKKENKDVTSREIVVKAINYLLKFQYQNKLSIFPNNAITKEKEFKASRLAWCYGDLGIGITLWQAAQSLKDNTIEEKAIEILLHSSNRRDLHRNKVIDAGLCHGTSGIAHIFNRMFLNTGKVEFKNTACYWFKETINMAKFKDGLAGYKSWQNRNNGWYNEMSFLEGIAGIGLSLISAVSDIKPKWDECLLLS